MVNDVDESIDFYTRHFGFEPGHNASPAFAEVTRGQPAALARRADELGRTPDARGRNPEPGGWNRIHFVVDDIAAEVERLRAGGVTFRNEIISGPGGQQILVDDPSGNPIELFRPAG